jgi:2'-phosphotransferase
MKRNHIHLAIGYPGDQQVISGMRMTCDIYIELDLEKVLHDGIPVYLSHNDVILTSGINGVLHPRYFK